MPCKACHKPKLQFKQGEIYSVGGQRCILARVERDLFNFICLGDGNRYFDAFSFEDLKTSFRGVEIKEERYANS